MEPRKRIAIVGGGAAGIFMGKSLKEENLDFICYEKSSEPAGTWNYRKECQEGIGSTMSTTTINNSKELGAASNYLYPEGSPNFLRHHELFKNLMNYGEEVLKNFLYDKEVIQVKRAEDYEQTGRWIVVVRDTKTNVITSTVFDGVMLCTGHLAHPFIPSLPGMQEFRGRILHTHELRTFESFAGQNVVVVGFGCSALDAATEISRVARQVYLSARNKSWIVPRITWFGVPFDFLILRRIITVLLNSTSAKFMSKFFASVVTSSKFNHRLYGIHSTSPVLCREPVISEDIFPKIASGAVVLRKGITKIGTDTVLFDGESVPTKVDTIIMATGYKENFSFLEEGILLKDDDKKYHLYKLMYPPHLKHPTLAFIGFLLSWGPGIPLGELQTRWATHLLSGKGSLPDKDVMMNDIDKRHKYNLERYLPSDKIHIRVDFMNYGDEIATQLGVKPNFFKMAFTDPKLFLCCFLGPYSSYQYRLQGPHKWKGARDAIINTHERVLEGFPSKARTERKYQRQYAIKTVLAFLVLFLLSKYGFLPVGIGGIFAAVVLCTLTVNVFRYGARALLYIPYLFLQLIVWSVSYFMLHEGI